MKRIGRVLHVSSMCPCSNSDCGFMNDFGTLCPKDIGFRISASFVETILYPKHQCSRGKHKNTFRSLIHTMFR